MKTVTISYEQLEKYHVPDNVKNENIHEYLENNCIEPFTSEDTNWEIVDIGK